MSWQQARLSDISEVVTGSTPSTFNIDYYGGDIPFITPTQLNKETYVGDSETYVTQAGAKAARLIPENSVMVCCIGSLGKVGISSRPLITNQQINSLVINGNIADPLYVYFYCKTLSNVLVNMAPKTTVAIVNKSRFSELTIPLPPLATQKHIARVLEQADQLRKQAQQMERELNQLSQSLFLEMFGDYRKQSDDRFVPLTTVADVVSGVAKGSDLKGKQTRVVPYIRVANVQDGFLNLSEIKEIEATERDIEKYVLQPGDILMTEGGDFDKLGRGAMWSGEVTECIHQNHIFRVRFSNEYEPKFFEYYLRSSKVKLYFLRCAKQTTNLASINMTQLKALPIPKEDRKKQEQFVVALELIEKQIKTVKTKGEYLEQAFKALMQRAFNGELTAPDRKAA